MEPMYDEFTCLSEQLILFFFFFDQSAGHGFVPVSTVVAGNQIWCLTGCYSQLYSDARNDPNYSEFRTGWLAWDIRLFPVTAAIPSSRVARCTPISVQEQPESQSQFFIKTHLKIQSLIRERGTRGHVHLSFDIACRRHAIPFFVVVSIPLPAWIDRAVSQPKSEKFRAYLADRNRLVIGRRRELDRSMIRSQ